MSPHTPFKKTNYSTSMCEDSFTEYEKEEHLNIGFRTPKRLKFESLSRTTDTLNERMETEGKKEDNFADPTIDREDFVAEEIYTVDLIQPVVNRFNITLNTGMTFRASLSMKPSTALVSDCMEAIKYSFSLASESMGILHSMHLHLHM